MCKGNLLIESQIAAKWLMYQRWPLNKVQAAWSSSCEITFPAELKPLSMFAAISLSSTGESLTLSTTRWKRKPSAKMAFIAFTAEPVKM